MIFETARHKLIIRIKKLSETISLALSIDLPSTHDISFGSVEKIYMHHPNLQYALATETPNIGNVRESFFINQLGVLGPMKYTTEGDFAFRDSVFEIGGRGKTNKQRSEERRVGKECR